MKIEKTTPYSITIEKKGMTTKILGESFLRGYGSPDFIISKSSLKHWEKDGKTILMTKKEIDEVINFALTELRDRGWSIECE